MVDDRKLWACAAHVLGTHGDEAMRFIASGIAAVAASGDESGIVTWRMIADRIDALRDGKGTGEARNDVQPRPYGSTHFSNEADITRLIGAILMEQSDEWADQRARYMTLETMAPPSDNPIVMLSAVPGS